MEINLQNLPYSPPTIECLRFGGRLGGIGIGCCGIDIIQGFNNDPDAEAYIPLTYGDALTSIPNGESVACYGPTNKDIFEAYLRTGTFDTQDMPNHAFLAAFSEDQLYSSFGQKWLAILRENHFEFIRTIDNSVYSGDSLLGEQNEDEDEYGSNYSHQVHIFGLFRNIGSGAIADPFTPPAAWTALPEPSLSIIEKYKAIGRPQLFKKSEVKTYDRNGG